MPSEKCKNKFSVAVLVVLVIAVVILGSWRLGTSIYKAYNQFINFPLQHYSPPYITCWNKLLLFQLLNPEI